MEETARVVSPVYDQMSRSYTCINYSKFQLQSEEVPAESLPNISSPADEQVTVQFLDSDSGPMTAAAASQNSVAKVDATEDLTLGRFLARPTTIDSFVWQNSDAIGVTRTIAPWKLFLNNIAIKKKIENYAFMRAKLHIKVIINATPFQYGMMRTAYYPLDGFVTRKFRGSSTSDLVPHSQVPGFPIQPAKNAGGEMELPFVYNKNWLDITSDADVTAFGSLLYVIYSALDVALSGGPTSITVKTLAWLTDVELMGSTGKLALQGEEDEYGNGPVSAPATALSNFAGYLTKIPIIGKWARATQIGASAVSRVASIFGFTNVPNINNVNGFYPMSAPHLATAEISVPYQKLALDPKTELTIDPTPFGVENCDQLSLSFIKKHESYFGTATWSTTNISDDLLFTTRVTPDLKISENIIGIAAAVVGSRSNMTPLAYTGNLFENWRGSLKFRFKIVSTQYHKGRLKFSFDPLYDIGTNNVDTNLVYTHILDLGETDEITIEVPYHQALGWLQVDSTSEINNWNAGALAPRAGVDNGSMTIRVYNSLEAPVSPSVVRILAFVSGGDDFEFANPTGQITSVGSAKLPSLFALQGDDEDHTEIYFGTKVDPDPDRYGMNFGESVLSLRKLLHRSVIMDTVPLPTGTASAFNIYRKGLCRMPYSPGFLSSGSFATTANKKIIAGTAPYAFNTMHPLPWVTGMYIGYRGSTNFAITSNSPKVTPNDIRFIRATDSGAITASNRVVVLQASILGSASLSTKCAGLDVVNNVRNGIAGYAVTSASANPTCMFNFPDYNNYNFAYANPIGYVEGLTTDGTAEQGVLVSLVSANVSATDEIGYSTLTTSVSAGPDFTCTFFLCCPTIDWLVGDPVPV